MFDFSVIIIKKWLKALATSVGYFNFLLFTSKAGTYSTECIFTIPFFIMFYVVFILLLDVATSLLQCCLLASFMNFLRILQYLI